MGVFLLGSGVLFAGSAVAEEATLEEMEGEGTEDDPYVITDINELQSMNEDLEAHYVLGNDIDASETRTWEAGSGFEPVSGEETPFKGSLDGQGHTVDGLVIQRSSSEYVGLIGYLEGEIGDVSFEETLVSGYGSVGGLVGENNGTITNVSVQGEVYGGDDNVGGLVGMSYTDATIEESSADARVDGDNEIGGLVGLNQGTITASSASGDVSGGENDQWSDNIGGLVGANTGQISDSYATGDIIDGERGSGGLVGSNSGPVRNAYATGDVHSDSKFVGGLVGGNSDSMTNVYATGDVTGDEYVGGLAGSNGGIISNAYTIGSVSGDDTVGALIGRERGTLRETYWNENTAEQSYGLGTSGNGDVPLRTAEMTGPAASVNMDGFDVEDVWTATDEYPILQMQVDEVDLTAIDTTLTAGDPTEVEVTLALTDGTTVTATEVVDYETGDHTDVTAGHVETQEPGTDEITVTVAGESDTVALEITEPPNIELEDASLEAPAVVTGTEVTGTATYANDGGPGAHTAELIVDGETVATERVWLEADAETTVEFEWTPTGDADTEYDVALDEADLGTLTVVGPAAVSLESLTAPDQIGSGTPYEVTAGLESDHDEPVLATATYELGGEYSATEPVVIEPEGSTVGFDHAHDAAPGVSLPHSVSLEGETLEEVSEVAEPPTFEITEVDAPEEVTVDEAFELTVTVENTGELEGTQSIAVEGADGELANEELTVGADATATASATVTESAAGDYEYTVSTSDDERTVSVTVAAADESTDSESGDGESDDADDGSDGLPGFGPVAAVIALSLAALFARRRSPE